MRNAGLLVGVALACGAPVVQAQTTATPGPTAVPPAPLPPGARAPIPASNPGNWVTTADYPLPALREERSGDTGFRVTVGLDGRVKACTVIRSSGSPDLDEATCRLVTERAVFRPALSGKGKPAIGFYSNRIRWVIPEKPESYTLPTSFQLQPVVRTMTYDVEPDGTPTNCSETENGEPFPPAMSRSPCQLGSRVKPYLDSNGNPVRKRVVIRYVVTVTDPPK